MWNLRVVVLVRRVSGGGHPSPPGLRIARRKRNPPALLKRICLIFPDAVFLNSQNRHCMESSGISPKFHLSGGADRHAIFPAMHLHPMRCAFPWFESNTHHCSCLGLAGRRAIFQTSRKRRTKPEIQSNRMPGCSTGSGTALSSISGRAAGWRGPGRVAERGFLVEIAFGTSRDSQPGQLAFSQRASSSTLRLQTN